MRQFDHPILNQVAALQFPEPNKVFITHGSALVVYGVRDSHDSGDIDLITSGENMLHLQQNLGWKIEEKSISDNASHSSKTVKRLLSPDGLFDVYEHDFVAKWFKEKGRGRVYLDQLKTFCEQDSSTGLWVATPEFVRLTKEGSTRPKDIEDIQLIDEYLTA